MNRIWKITYACPDCDNSINVTVRPGQDQDGRLLPFVRVTEMRCPKCDHLPVMASSAPELSKPSRIIVPSMVPPPQTRLKQ